MIHQTQQRICDVFREVFKNKGQQAPNLNEQTVLDGSLGLESLDFAEVVMRLEGEFGFDPFAGGVPDGVRTIGDVTKLYEQQTL